MLYPTSRLRILIVRLSAIGDVLHTLPVLNALRDAFPHAFLSWVVDSRAADLLRGHKSLDELVVVPRGWATSPVAAWRLWRHLKARRFDVALDVQGLTKSSAAAWLSGARRRIGYGGRDARELSRCFNNELVLASASHIIDRNLELLRPLGIATPPVRFDLPEDRAEAVMAEDAIVRLALGSGYAVINPGAGWPSKLWPAKRYGGVARFLGATLGLPSLVVWAGSRERAWAEEIESGSGGHARLAPSTTLLELAAILRRARLFVGSDTGPLHLAVAVGTPSVGMFGPMPAERNGPYGPGHAAVEEMAFAGTNRRQRRTDPAPMAAIGVERVCAACERLLSRPLERCA